MKILLFAHDGKLGDSVVNTAFVDGALQLDPAAELHVLGSDTAADFWAMDRRIRKIWIFRNPPLRECLRTSWAIRREHYDFVVTWKERFRSEKTRLMLLLSSPRQAILYEEGKSPDRVNHALRKCELSLRHIYGERAAALDLRPRLDMDLDPPASFAGQLAPGSEVILLNLFAADPARSIRVADAAAILDGLARLAPAALLALSCTDASEATAREAAAASGRPCQVVNTGLSLRRLISLCARVDCIISPDTSLIHIASALDKPVLGIFQNDGTKSIEWAPRSSRSAIVIGPERNGIQGFSVSEVLEKIQGLRLPPPVAVPVA